ncbi:hypothetical protein U1Q18_030809 [Sarracenia purpurea var. burkii]
MPSCSGGGVEEELRVQWGFSEPDVDTDDVEEVVALREETNQIIVPEPGQADDGCGDSDFPAMSEEKSFETLPFPGPDSYPRRIAVIGDLGATSNSSTTVDHLMDNDPSVVLMVGDLTYANQYLTTGGKGASCFSCSFPDAPIRETYQPRWDGWGRSAVEVDGSTNGSNQRGSGCRGTTNRSTVEVGGGEYRDGATGG